MTYFAKNKKAKIFSYIIFILSPVLLLISLSLIFKRNAFMGQPVWSDEISYWHEIFSFSKCGFKTGYYGMEEMLPKIGCFGTHGFFQSLFYFPFAKIFGWGNNSIVIANLIFTIVCFSLLLFLIRPSMKQSIFLTILYIFYPSILFFAATSMTEILNYGLLSLFFVFFYKYYKTEDKKRKNLFLILMLLIGTLCSFYRIIYVVLFLLPTLILCKFKFSKKFVILLPSWLIFSGAIYFINSLFTAPYPSGVLYNVMNSGSLKMSTHLILINVKENLIRLFDLKTGENIEVFQRILYLFLIVLYFSLIFFKAKTKKSKKDFLTLSFRNKFDEFYLMQVILLLLPLCIVVTIYDVYGYRDYRSLSPFLFASLLNLILFKRNLVLKVLTPVFILFFFMNIVFLPSCFCVKEDARYNSDQKYNLKIINEFVKYDVNENDPFKNTILTDNFNFYLWSNVEPGIGIEFGSLNDHLRSKYLLLNLNSEINGYINKGKTDFGYLYIKN